MAAIALNAIPGEYPYSAQQKPAATVPGGLWNNRLNDLVDS
jgi:hypothetical protein